MNRSIPTTSTSTSARCRRFAGRLGVVAASSALVAAGSFAQPVLAQSDDDAPPPPHGHMLVLGVVMGDDGPESFRKCVDVAAGQELPLHAHHDHFHRGTAGESLRAAGNFPIPTAPITPFESCADLEAAFGQ